MKKINKSLPFLILIFIVFLQLFLFLTYNKAKELKASRDAIINLMISGAKTYRSPKIPLEEPLYIFAQKIDRDIPLGSKILYLNTTQYGTDDVKYFQINTFKPRNHDAAYAFKTNPSETEMLNFLELSGSRFIVVYGDKEMTQRYGGRNGHMNGIFQLKANKLELYKSYD